MPQHQWALLDAVVDPVETHVNGSRATLFHGFVGDTGCAELSVLPISSSVVQMVVPCFQLKKTAHVSDSVAKERMGFIMAE